MSGMDRSCMHAYMHTCMYACMHTCIHACMHTCIHELDISSVLNRESSLDGVVTNEEIEDKDSI